ncbi:MAG: hypothetical protein WCR74_04595 [Betaproteobacteria bacterium]
MINPMNYPLLVLVLSFLLLWFSASIGSTFLAKRHRIEEGTREDFNLVTGTTLTMLGLIIGFSFSMAINRYDQRKTLEDAEANAIGTEYARADLLAAADGAKLRSLLRAYTDQRVLFYSTRDEREIREINIRTVKLQNELWAAVVGPAAEKPTPITALVVNGMNDVLNAQGHTQAAWWNRIPAGAWILMVFFAICSNMLIGYGARHAKAERSLLLLLPFIVSIAFFSIADIDSPTGGIIRVVPKNLNALVESMRPN